MNEQNFGLKKVIQLRNFNKPCLFVLVCLDHLHSTNNCSNFIWFYILTEQKANAMNKYQQIRRKFRAMLLLRHISAFPCKSILRVTMHSLVDTMFDMHILAKQYIKLGLKKNCWAYLKSQGYHL